MQQQLDHETSKDGSKSDKNSEHSGEDSSSSSVASSKSGKQQKKSAFQEIKKLTWDDYSGLPDVDDPAIAHTKWKIGYNYTLKLGTDESEFLIEVDVWCKVDSSSWVKTKFVELLNHEQGHYYIGLICALEFKKEVSEFEFTENHKKEISDLFNENLKNHLEMERQYDIETLNMLNTAKQKVWDLKLMKQLKTLQQYA